MSQYVSLFAFFVIVAAAATTGALYTTGPWYEALTKPWWTPPNWLFPIAWTILYFMIAIAGWRVWQAQGIGPALVVWGIGLALNTAWSWLMFGRHEIGLAMVDVTLMWMSIVAFIVLALPVDRTAALLFAPYLVWVSYAAALNFVIWRWN
jgi:translocator protein